ncbi:MmyB family transcriptional regulator [Streptomyces sp. NPDC002577]
MRWHTHGSKTFHHPEVGDITPGYQSMQIEGPPGQRFIAYYAEPGTPEHDAMALLDLPAREPAGATASRDASTDAESSPSS